MQDDQKYTNDDEKITKIKKASSTVQDELSKMNKTGKNASCNEKTEKFEWEVYGCGGNLYGQLGIG